MIGSTLAGTTTSAALINFGTTVLPMYLKMTSTMTLYPEISSKVMFGSSFSPGLLSSENIDLNGTGAIMDEVEFGDLKLPMLKDNQSTEQTETSLVNDLHTHRTNDLEGKGHSRSHPKDTNNRLNSFLPPLLALLTLKDALLDYCFGAKINDFHGNDLEQNDDNDLDSTVDLSPQTTEYCSSGPCQMDSWPNCWNVTSDFDWTEYKDSSSKCCRDAEPCCSNCVLNGNPSLSNGEWNGQIDNGLWSNDVIKCCCKRSHSESASWLKGSLNAAIIDLNLRFSTHSLYPVYVTT